MKTVRLTTAQAIVRFLTAQRTVVDGEERPLLAGVFGIFGHGNVTCLGEALHDARDVLPDLPRPERAGHGAGGDRLRQGDAAPAVHGRDLLDRPRRHEHGHGRSGRARQPAAAAAARRATRSTRASPTRCCSRSSTSTQPSVTVNDAFRPVTRYWDRITHPAQVAQSLPLAIATLLDPADCGPAFLGLPQDVQAEAYDYPVRLFEPVVHELRRPRPDRRELAAAVAALRGAKAPLIIAGGGVHYSLAEARAARASPSSTACRSSRRWRASRRCVADHPLYAGPIGVTGAPQANALAARGRRRAGRRHAAAGLHDRLVDGLRERGPAHHRAQRGALRRRQAPQPAARRRRAARVSRRSARRSAAGRCPTPGASEAHGAGRRVSPSTCAPPSRRAPARASRRTRRSSQPSTRRPGPRTTPSRPPGGFPGELNVNWLSRGVATFDCEYGFSCMGYELAGAWGASMARSRGEVFAFVGDGSYLMLNSELLSSVISGHKLIARALRQRRLRRDRAPAGGPGRRLVQQHVRGHRPQPRRGRLGRARPRPRLRGRARRLDRRPAGGARARPGRRPQLRDRACARPRTRGRRAGRSGRSACPRLASAPRSTRRAPARTRAAAASGSAGDRPRARGRGPHGRRAPARAAARTRASSCA